MKVVKSGMQDGDTRWRHKMATQMAVQDGDTRWRHKMATQDGGERKQHKVGTQDLNSGAKSTNRNKLYYLIE